MKATKKELRQAAAQKEDLQRTCAEATGKAREAAQQVAERDKAIEELEEELAGLDSALEVSSFGRWFIGHSVIRSFGRSVGRSVNVGFSVDDESMPYPAHLAVAPICSERSPNNLVERTNERPNKQTNDQTNDW